MEDIEQLLEKRKTLLKKLSELGDMRRGSVVEQVYEAKNKNGANKKQGPYFLYSYKQGGKTVSKRLPNVRAAERYKAQIREFRKFEDLSAELVEINHKICDLRGDSEQTPQEKKLRRSSSRKSRGE